MAYRELFPRASMALSPPRLRAFLPLGRQPARFLSPRRGRYRHGSAGRGLLAWFAELSSA